MSRTPDQLVEDYLRELDAELAALPRQTRREVRDDIASHIAEARTGRESEAEVRALLDRVGDPAEVAAEARERLGVPPRTRRSLEVVALVLLSVGMILPGLGWLVGVILLWISDVWNAREKLLGTLLAPAGWLIPAWIVVQTVGGGTCESSFDANGHALSNSCNGGTSHSGILWLVLLIALSLASVGTMIYLALSLRRRNRSAVLA